MRQAIIFSTSFLLAIGITALFFGRNRLLKNNENATDNFDIKDFCQEISIEGQSMEPTLREGDLVCVYLENPQANDLVVFKCKNCGLDKPAVKRLKKIKDGCYWVEGDNPSFSTDSRQFGFLCSGNLEYIWKAKKE